MFSKYKSSDGSENQLNFKGKTSFHTQLTDTYSCFKHKLNSIKFIIKQGFNNLHFASQ